MDRLGKGFMEDCQDGKEMESFVQAGDWTSSGGLCRSTGSKSKISSHSVEDGCREPINSSHTLKKPDGMIESFAKLRDDRRQKPGPI
jgi:hypothetical protein